MNIPILQNKNIEYDNKDYNYLLHKHLIKIQKKDQFNITSNTKHFVCIYQILKSIETTIIQEPFIQYLLYKYPPNKNKNSESKYENTLIFPFFENIKNLSEIHNNAKNIMNDVKYKGYIYFENNYYYFYEKEYVKKETFLILIEKALLWTTIHEICNSNSYLFYPIHSSVYNIFYNHPYLIYLYYKNEKIEIPIIGFFGSAYSHLNFISTLGYKAHTTKEFGPYYYFGSLKQSMRYGGWSSNYREISVKNKIITDIYGRHNEGGVIRFALFLGNTRNILYRPSDPFHWFIHMNDYKNKNNANFEKNMELKKKLIKKNVGKWTKNYDSLSIGKIEYKNNAGYFNINPKYIVKGFDQYTPLSIHLIDNTSLPKVWDPFFTNYKFK